MGKDVYHFVLNYKPPKVISGGFFIFERNIMIMKLKEQFSTKNLAILGMLAAMAYIVTVFVRIPLMPATPFLNYDIKDVIIAIGGFLFGPVSALILSVAVSLLEFITVSDTGIIGLIMNILSTLSFVIPASLMYSIRRKKSFAVTGLIIGVLFMTGMMVLWNYFITPLYMKISREAVCAMLPTVFLPFNLIKGTLNAIFTIIIYKPLVKAFRAIRL